MFPSPTYISCLSAAVSCWCLTSVTFTESTRVSGTPCLKLSDSAAPIDCACTCVLQLFSASWCPHCCAEFSKDSVTAGAPVHCFFKVKPPFTCKFLEYWSRKDPLINSALLSVLDTSPTIIFLLGFREYDLVWVSAALLAIYKQVN